MGRQQLQDRVATLRRELASAEAELAGLDHAHQTRVRFEDLFDLEEIQALQDAFALAMGVGSLITTPEGRPITRPSNFCDLCQNIIRKTAKGLANCMRSDAVLGRHDPAGPTLRPCLSSGLWDCGASITVGGRHIANWLIGQVRNQEIDEERVLAYAREIGADEEEFRRAFGEVTVMPLGRFKQAGRALFLIANMLSVSAYRNLQFAEKLAELKVAGAEVAHLKSFLSNIVDSMPSILVGVDPEGRITHWNMRAASATGVDRAHAEGRLLADVLPELAGAMGKVHQAIRERRPVVSEMMTREEDGIRHYEDVSVYPLIANGVQGAVIRVDDITERVRIEEMMIQSEKMLSVGGLAAGMAHEINNPLAAILGNARLLQKRLLEDSRKNRAEAERLGLSLDAVFGYMEARSVSQMLGAILESGQRAGKVVTNMLDFSRKSDGHRDEVDVAWVLDRAVDLVKSGHDLSHSYNFKDIEFVREYGADRPLVRCDAGQVEQVFFNILNNGAQAMTSAHRDTGRMPRFVLRCQRQGTGVRVEIEDNGPGMNEDVRRRVFEPFFTTKEVGVGTGLGMSVAYFIVTEGHGGTMRVQSRPGLGARFIINLPGE